MSDPYQPNQPEPYQPQAGPPGQPYPPQPQPGQPVPYGQPYPPVGPVAYEHPKANTILILGIVGVVVPVVSFVAWFMGNGVVKEIRSSGIAYSNEQNAVIGRILGIVLSIVQLVSVVLGIVWFVGWILFVLYYVNAAGG